MECPFCQGHIGSNDRGQYRGIIGEKPDDWTPCHISCARRNQEFGKKITVRWFPVKA